MAGGVAAVRLRSDGCQEPEGHVHRAVLSNVAAARGREA